MNHSNRSDFSSLLERTSAQTGFSLLLLEKDYYLTLLLSRIHLLSERLVFKGGTCLNKIYFSYFRLSEDLDFSLLLPKPELNRQERKRLVLPIKEKLPALLKDIELEVENIDQAGHNESTQYIFYIQYQSAIVANVQSIKLEINLSTSPILNPILKPVTHKFIHPFTKEMLFDGGQVLCLSLKELVSEKLRAAATRKSIAPRDFYDLNYLIRNEFKFDDIELWTLFKRKLEEDGFKDFEPFRFNLGRSFEEIQNMENRLKDELFPVLTPKEKVAFNLQDTFKFLNAIFMNK